MESIPDETPIDPSCLLDKSITTRAQLNIVEAANVLKATVKYLAAKPSRRSAQFDFAWGLKLHEEMFGDVWDWAGKIRMRDVNLGIPWGQIEPALFNLFENLKVWQGEFIEQAAMLHHKAVHIHPFPNGNGRWSRMLANIWLKRNDEPITVWPEEAIGSVSLIRAEYINAIKAADGGDYSLLTELHRRFS